VLNFAPLEKIANAVLYEGFLLYPYRKSSVKNQQRWHFGTIGPAGSEESNLMQTECLLEGHAATTIDIRVRFLQQDIEREVNFSGLPLAGLLESRLFAFPPIQGELSVAAVTVSDNVFRLTVRIVNLSEGVGGDRSMLSTHTLLGVEGGTFLSLLDPPEEHRVAATACRNIGTWPVLAGSEGERTLMFSSPIILYDYPQIAPESAGDLFDGTEIDEILTLRVLTLSDEEKKEIAAGDDRARQILERTESLPPEAVAKMHGAIRGLRNASKLNFREGDRVRLRPRKKADIFDIALAGKIAIVESIESDFENNVHLAVTVEDDPGRDFGQARQIGHRFFFGPDEVELL
jgi:hypothetical protein